MQMLLYLSSDVALLVRGRTRAELEANSNEVCNLFYQQCNRQKLQVAEHKCQILLIAKKGGSLTRRPTIRINNRRIKIVRVLRYLGLYIDEKLTWMPHILNLRKRTAIIAQHFRMQRGFHWGINSHIQKALYLTVVEKMVSYGAAIWAFPMQGRKIRHLSALQRPFLLSITRAFRTTSTDALNILAGVLPLHLRIEEEAVTQQVHQLRLSLTYDYVTFSQEQFENKTSQLHIHPAIKGIGIHLTKNPAYVAPSGYISIYTDGSRIDEKVGSAFVVLSEQQQPLHQWQMQLSTENSVFQSEALAIHEAIRYLTNNKISKALIHTDSLSSMQAIANSEHTSPQIAGIQKSLRENAHNHYVIKWIKAHTGIYGNELADGLAKDAATGNNITTVQIHGLPHI
ncbi:uncharacterized protein LOC118196354 [Stegodyphus dumicola]|uniref:uncharacterized protein LOC118196354 n=1 Tax=Stegodyphus dumicola TaxID=202533 RepID=UPI0015B1B551|nr:uncharacterized protein LOC118196354 [Stegodyphus dumicola]